jgi:RNA polymerase sigma-70 factor, ECF subfamily
MTANPAVALPADPAGPVGDIPRERLAALFDAHEDRLYRLARRLTGSADEARDLVQDTFFKAARSLKSIPAGTAEKEAAWLVQVLVNIRRDQWRRASVRARKASLLRASGAIYPATLESALITKRAVWAALDVLHPRRRAIVVMHEMEGMSRTAIASCLGISTITVGWHLSMARRELKSLLQSHIGDVR